MMRAARKNKNAERRGPAQASPVATAASSRDLRSVVKQVAEFKAKLEAAGYEVVIVTRDQWEARRP